MKKQIVLIGALSASEGIAQLLADKYPAKYTVKSIAPFSLSLPEINVFVRPGETQVVTVKSADLMARAVHSATQVAFLNGTDQLLSIQLGVVEDVEPENEAEPEVAAPQAEPEPAANDKPAAKKGKK